jgi:NADP-dependent 3-hydroxy acid dehydrogenase YdfG
MHVVVTGASSGIGEAIAREYFSRNAHVTLVARRRDLLEKLAADGDGRAHIVTADLSDPEQVTTWVDSAEKASGPIDVLINNAGVQIVRPFIETAFEDAARIPLYQPFLDVAMQPGISGYQYWFHRQLDYRQLKKG